MKEALLSNRTLTFEVELTEAAHYIPCVGSLADSTECKQCVTKYPVDLSYPTECCQVYRVMRNPDGTFYSHNDDTPVGGHAMLLAVCIHMQYCVLL